MHLMLGFVKQLMMYNLEEEHILQIMYFQLDFKVEQQSLHNQLFIYKML